MGAALRRGACPRPAGPLGVGGGWPALRGGADRPGRQEHAGLPGLAALRPGPAYRDDEVELFESGAIVLHLASRSEALAPADAAGRARVATWVLCALNTLEPDFAALAELDLFQPGDILMTTVLRLVEPAMLDGFTTLAAYRSRCEARPAFARALEAQVRPFREHAPAA